MGQNGQPARRTGRGSAPTGGGTGEDRGYRLVEDLDATATNKRVVHAYLDGLDDGCVCPTEFAQHSSSSSAPIVAGPASVLQVAGCGNFVAVYRHRRPARVRGSGEAVCDLYRLDHGHIVEHWDTVQPMA